MKPARLLPASRTAAGLMGLCGLVACATNPAPTYQVSSHAEAARPVSVAVTLDSENDDGPRTNQWGGVIPDAKPTTKIEDGGLGEIN